MTKLEVVLNDIANTVNPERKPGVYSGVMNKISREQKESLVSGLAEELKNN